MDNNSSLQLGIDAFKAGNKDQAHFYLLKAIREEPNNERAWGWLSNTAQTNDEKVHCLQQILRINPQNEWAKKTLAELQANDWVNAAPSISAPTVSTVKSSPTPIPVTIVSKKPWYRESIIMVLCLLFFFPAFMLLFVTDEKQKNSAKIIVVIVQILLCFWGLYIGFSGYSNLVR